MFTSHSGMILSLLVSNGPAYLMMIAGIVLALQYAQRFPKASRLTVLGLSVLLLNSVVGAYLGWWLPRLMVEQGSPVQSISFIMTARQFVQSLISAAGLGLLLAAVFSGRREEA